MLPYHFYSWHNKLVIMREMFFGKKYSVFKAKLNFVESFCFWRTQRLSFLNRFSVLDKFTDSKIVSRCTIIVWKKCFCNHFQQHIAYILYGICMDICRMDAWFLFFMFFSICITSYIVKPSSKFRNRILFF